MTADLMLLSGNPAALANGPDALRLNNVVCDGSLL